MPITFDPAGVVYFSSPAEFRRWLAKNHDKADSLWVGYHRKATGVPTMTWPQSVDEALCYGWIDGIRKGVDQARYAIRFTPRRRDSVWSTINVARIKVLEAEGRMRPSGSAAFRAMKPDKSGIYSFEQQKNPELPLGMTKRFRANKRAWEFFTSQPAGYQRLAKWWIVSAKKEETRERRFGTLLKDSEEGRRLAGLQPAPRSSSNP